MSVEQLAHLPHYLRQFSQETAEQAARLIKLTEETSAQTTEVIALSKVMKRLTVVITILTDRCCDSIRR